MDDNMAQTAELAMQTGLDVAFCRGHFPALGGDWVFLENAGGTLVPDQVIARLNQFTANARSSRARATRPRIRVRRASPRAAPRSPR